MTPNRKISLTIILFGLSLLTPQIAFTQNNEAITDVSGHCIDSKILDDKTKSYNFFKCCISMDTPDPKIWGKNDLNMCPKAASGWECYCRRLNLTPLSGTKKEDTKKQEPITFKPQVSIPESTITAQAKIQLANNTSLLSDYIIAIFKYSIGIVGIIAAIVLMFGGVRWLTAGGNSGVVSEARTYIIGSLTGLLLSLGSFLLLSTINGNLVNLKIIEIKPIQKIDLTKEGCCAKVVDDPAKTLEENTTTENTDSEKCYNQKKDFKQVQFYYSYKAESNKCVPDNKKRICCLSHQVKDSGNTLDLYNGCTSEEPMLEESMLDFTNRCKDSAIKANKDYPDKWGPGYKVQEFSKCSDCGGNHSQLCSCEPI